MTINIKNLVLLAGKHPSPKYGMCVMELASYIAREPFSDHPKCVSKVIGAFMRSWNDSLDGETRQKLKPFAKRILNTAASKEIEEKRAWMAIDWMFRQYLPTWLDLAKLSNDAATLRLLPEIASVTLIATKPVLNEAYKNAKATALDTESVATALDTESVTETATEIVARSVAWSVAQFAAMYAAEFATRSTMCAAELAGEFELAAAWFFAELAARFATRSVAWSAARSAARSAALPSAVRSAAELAVRPTVEKLQQSAFELIDRMIAVGK